MGQSVTTVPHKSPIPNGEVAEGAICILPFIPHCYTPLTPRDTSPWSKTYIKAYATYHSSVHGLGGSQLLNRLAVLFKVSLLALHLPYLDNYIKF